jgi:hypothetical protein
MGSVLDRAAPGQLFSEYFGFPCHSFIPLIAPQLTSSLIQGCYSRLINGCSNNGLCSTTALKINKNNKMAGEVKLIETYQE